MPVHPCSVKALMKAKQEVWCCETRGRTRVGSVGCGWGSGGLPERRETRDSDSSVVSSPSCLTRRLTWIRQKQPLALFCCFWLQSQQQQLREEGRGREGRGRPTNNETVQPQKLNIYDHWWQNKIITPATNSNRKWKRRHFNATPTQSPTNYVNEGYFFSKNWKRGGGLFLCDEDERSCTMRRSPWEERKNPSWISEKLCCFRCLSEKKDTGAHQHTHAAAMGRELGQVCVVWRSSWNRVTQCFYAAPSPGPPSELDSRQTVWDPGPYPLCSIGFVRKSLAGRSKRGERR